MSSFEQTQQLDIMSREERIENAFLKLNCELVAFASIAVYFEDNSGGFLCLEGEDEMK